MLQFRISLHSNVFSLWPRCSGEAAEMNYRSETSPQPRDCLGFTTTCLAYAYVSIRTSREVDLPDETVQKRSMQSRCDVGLHVSETMAHIERR